MKNFILIGILTTFSLIFGSSGTSFGATVEMKLNLHSIYGGKLTSTEIKTPFNLITDMNVRLINFSEDTYNMSGEEINEYIHGKRFYTQQRATQGVNLEEATKVYQIKRDIYRHHELNEEDFIQMAGDTIKANAKSFDEKIKLLSSMLEDMYYIYDYKRTQGEGSAEVSFNDIAKSLDGRYSGAHRDRAGVCRDMHQAILKIAKASGVPEGFGISFISSGAPHLNLIFTDPENPKRVINLNYDIVFNNEGGWENSLLTQNHVSPSLGLGFYLWNANDKVELYIPSDKGVLLYMGSGGDLEELNMALPENYTNISAETRTKLGKFALFYGHAGGGDGTHVLSLNQALSKKINNFIETDIGHSVFYSQRTMDTRDDTDLNTIGYYIRNSFKFSKNFKFNSQEIDLYFNTFIYGAIFQAVVKSDDPNKSVNNLRFDFHGSLKTGIKHQAYFSDSILTTKLELSILPQTGNIANFSQYNLTEPGFDFMPSGLFLSQNYEFNINNSLTGELGHKLSLYPIDGMPVIIGQLYGKLKYKNYVQARSSAVGCLSDYCPAFLPGTARRIDNSLNYIFSDKFKFGFSNSLYEDGNYYFGLNLKIIHY